MDRRTGVAVLGGLGLAAMLALAAPALAQGPNGAVYTQCPGDNNGDSIPDVNTIDTDGDGHPDAKAKCMHLTGGDGFVTMADGRKLYMFGFSDITGKPASQAMDVGALVGELPGPDHQAPRGRRVLPEPHERRHEHAARPLRPPLGALPRVPAGRARLRRHARELDRREHGVDAHLLLQDRRARHLHVPLSRRGDRAHADGDARQPLRGAPAEHDRGSALGNQCSRRSCAMPARSSGNQYVYNDGDGIDRLRRREADPDRVVRSRTSTTRARPCSRSRSPRCETATRCSTAAAIRTR